MCNCIVLLTLRVTIETPDIKYSVADIKMILFLLVPGNFRSIMSLDCIDRPDIIEGLSESYIKLF